MQGPTSRNLGAGVDVAVHFCCPFKKVPKIVAFPPHEFPKFQETDLLHFYTAVSLDPPQQVGAAPRGEAVSSSCVPQKSQNVAHAVYLV